MGSPQTQLVLREQDVVKLACEFMENRDMNISQIALERKGTPQSSTIEKEMFYFLL